MSNIPKDPVLYERLKKKVWSMYKRPSAYRSGYLVKMYKQAYYHKYGNTKAYTTKKNKNLGLTRWFKERWQTPEGYTTYQKKGDVFRPTRRITKKTPVTLHELTPYQIKKAREEKKRTGRVIKFTKKKYI